MGFILDGLDAEAYDREYTDRQLLQRILGYFRPHLPVMSGVAGLIMLNAVMDAALPFLIARSLDQLEGAANLQETIWQRTAWLIVAIFFAGALSWTFNFFRQKYTARTVGDVVLKLRQDAFDAVLARDMSFYDEFSTGKIVSRVTSDTQDFSNVVTLTLNLMSQVLIVTIVVGLLVWIDFRLALIALALAPIVVLTALAFRRIARWTTTQARRVLAEVNANVQESVTGISVAKNFRQEQRIYDEFKRVNAQTYRWSLRQGLTFSSIFPILGTISGIGTALIVYFGGRSVIGGAVSAGDFYLFIEGVNLFWFPLVSIASFWSQFQLGLAASERVFALVDAEPRVVQTDHKPAPRLRGRIEFRNLDFRYTDKEQVLKGFNLTVEAGETLALVGHTGAGKSSLGKLVARFYEFQGGELLIDGQDIRTFDLHSYRRQLGIVPQTPFLFAGTVADNIRYGKPDATDDEVLAVATRVGGGDWLDALPQGLATPVGEEGKGISMGQRQLVALARVLLQDPAIIILDEATASVDPLTEAQIQEGLEVVLQERTAIVIAHRLSTIKSADRIIVLRKGAIIEEGDHDALMARGGHYAELYNTYFRHQSLEYIESWRKETAALHLVPS
ncbi:MAG TPA: ABC transporter ATP-binding protein [Caldilineaceae bacterium]|nr:ABC transporter ATP-binding protein [Caldilineaceae bacterium]